MNSSLVNHESTQSQVSSQQHIDLLTVGAIAIVTYLLSTIMHEALGHGLAAILVGLHPQRVTSVDLEVSFVGVPDWKVRVVAAAGCIANVVLALIALGLLRMAREGKPATHYFLWLLSTINLIIPGGYLMVLTFAGFGDWNDFVQGLPAQLAWKIGLTLLGVLISLLGLYLGVRKLDPFLGQESGMRHRRSLALTLTAYLAGSAANTIAGVFNPTSPILILISAAASTFGGTAFLMWINQFVGKPRTNSEQAPRTVTRSWLWIGLGVAALLIYFVVLGPGLPR